MRINRFCLVKQSLTFFTSKCFISKIVVYLLSSPSLPRRAPTDAKQIIWIRVSPIGKTCFASSAKWSASKWRSNAEWKTSKILTNEYRHSPVQAHPFYQTFQTFLLKKIQQWYWKLQWERHSNGTYISNLYEQNKYYAYTCQPICYNCLT